MATRAVVIRYNVDAVEASGDVVLDIKVIFADTLDPLRTQVLMAQATLNMTAPATWNASIKDAIIAAGNSLGYLDLTQAGVFIPQYA